jgi:hypothetical protein
MKEQQTACVILVLLAMGFLYGAQTFHGKMAAAQSAAEDARVAAQTAETKLAGQRRELSKKTEASEGLRSYLEDWDVHLRSTQSAQSTEQRIVDLVKQSDIFTESQRFELVERRDDTVIKSALRAHITVKDDYAKAMNWLADLEAHLPTSRITSCVLRRGESGNDIRMQLIVDLPILSAL